MLTLALAGCGDTGPTDPADPQDPVVQQVLVSPSPIDMREGDTQTLTISVIMSDGSQITGPTGALSPAFTTSDGTVARVNEAGLVTGVAPGQAFIQAKVQTVASTVTANVSARPVELRQAQAHPASGTAGEPLPGGLAIQVVDIRGDGVPDVDVQFTVTDGDGALSDAEETTGPDGIATVDWILGAGPNTVRAEVADVPSLELNVTGNLVVEAPADVTISGGDAQSGVVGTSLTQPLSVRVVDGDGVGIPGLTVSWASTAGAFSAPAGSSNATIETQTDGEGVAEVTWTLGTAAGTQSVTATVSGLSVTFTATASADVPHSLDVTPGSVSVVVGSTAQLTGSLRDQHGNPVGGSVSWSSRQPGIAAISATGVVSGIAPGVATIDASAAGFSATAQVTVEPAAASGVEIHPGQDIQAIVDQHPPGTAFVLTAGRHVGQTVYPRTGDVFSGEPGAIMDGENATGYAFRWKNNEWAQNVTIRGLIIERYVSSPDPNDQMGAILAGWHLGHPATAASSGWLIENNEIRNNRYAGIRVGAGMTVRNNNVHHNGQMGITGIGGTLLIEGNVVSDNGHDYKRGGGGDDPPGIHFKESGIKILISDNVTIRNNTVERNDGTGIWVDDDVRFIEISGNTVSANAVAGILVEKSYNATVHHNVLSGNGTAGDCGGNCGGLNGSNVFVQNSSDVEIFQNTVSGGKHGITAIHQNRGSGQYGLWDTRDIEVHHNTISLTSTAQMNGFDDDSGDLGYYSTSTIFFHDNTYSLPNGYSGFWWLDGANPPGAKGHSVSEWQALGQDPGSTFN